MWRLLLALALLLTSCAVVKEKVEAMKPTIEVQDVSLISITPTTAKLNFTLNINNPNPIGATISRLSYEAYFYKDMKWVFLGKGERGEILIKERGITAIDVPFELQIKEAILALFQFFFQGRKIDIKVKGSAWLKVGPISFEIPFEQVRTIGG